MARAARRLKRRIGFTNGEPETVPAEPGPEVPGHMVESTYYETNEEERHRVRQNPQRRPGDLW